MADSIVLLVGWSCHPVGHQECCACRRGVFGPPAVMGVSVGFDLSGADLAAVLGVSRNQAHALASRARGQLERELGVLLVARTGRWACPTLDLTLCDWDGQPTSPIHKQVARHIGQCDACTYRRRSALRPAALDAMAPSAALPAGRREKLLRLCADDSPPAQAYREEVTQRAGPFGANGFPQQVRQPKGRMLALAGGAAASVILVAIVTAGVITVLAPGGSHTPLPLDGTGSHSAPATANPGRDRAGGSSKTVSRRVACRQSARNQRPAARGRAITATCGSVLPVRRPVAATEAVRVHVFRMPASTSTPPRPSIRPGLRATAGGPRHVRPVRWSYAEAAGGHMPVALGGPSLRVRRVADSALPLEH